MRLLKFRIYNYRKWRLLLLLMSFFFGATSCYYDNEEELYPATGSNCDTTTVSFVNDIKPILVTSCIRAGCHASSAPAVGISLESHSGVKAVAEDGRLAAAVTHSGAAVPMPYNEPKLLDCQVNTIIAWVNQGALNN
ncbi:MAG: hypothetical protein WD077_12115 [Bacteroidia bacterium]